MKAVAGFLFTSAFFVLIIVKPEETLADEQQFDPPPPPPENEGYLKCGNRCAEKSCESFRSGNEGTCPKTCQPGYYCLDGYLREYPNGRCILPIECPAPAQPQLDQE